MENRKTRIYISFAVCCVISSLWRMISMNSSSGLWLSNCESTAFSPLSNESPATRKDQLLRPPTREELEQAALTLVSAQHHGLMKREDDYRTFINNNNEVRDQQNGGIEQDNKVGFITPLKVIEGPFDKAGNQTFRCELEIRQISQVLPSKVDNIATFVLFQSNGGHQLQRFVSYHSKVIGMENIVIIDHQSDRILADPHTASLLEKYNNHGSDVWHCDGPFLYKENMWSEIIHQYKEATEFVFPLDIDELIAVKTARKLVVRDNETNNLHVNYKEEMEELRWDAESFKNALLKLPNPEKPFKIEQGLILPMDCGNIQFNMSLFSNVINHDLDPLGFTNNVQYVGRRRPRESSCLDKAFFRSQDFLSTDTGNHIGQTHRYKDTWKKNCTHVVVSNWAPDMERYSDHTINRHDSDQNSDLYMMHFQQVTFAEWLIHLLRGASDRSFNKLSEANDCAAQRTSIHYCKGWETIKKVNFSPKEMMKIYRREVCSLIVHHHYPLPVGQLFS